MTPSGLPPKDLETIAAFIDQRLPPEERAEFLERLDREEDLYEVFVEIVRFRDEEMAEGIEGNPEDGDGAEIIAHRAGRNWSRWTLPAAAMLFVAVAVGWISWSIGGTEPAHVEKLVADGRLDVRLGDGWLTPVWSEVRGVSRLSSDADTAFRIGVRDVDLQVALLLGREDDAVGLTHELERLLAGIEFSELVQKEYAALRGSIEARGTTSPELIDQAAAIREVGQAYLPQLGEAYELGRWTETGRLAAKGSNVEVLTSSDFRKTLVALRASAGWEDEVQDKLTELSRRLSSPSDELDLEALETAFDSILVTG